MACPSDTPLFFCRFLSTLRERRNGSRLIVLDVEHGDQLRDDEQIAHLAGQVKQLQLPAGVFTAVYALTSSPKPELSM